MQVVRIHQGGQEWKGTRAAALPVQGLPSPVLRQRKVAEDEEAENDRRRGVSALLRRVPLRKVGRSLREILGTAADQSTIWRWTSKLVPQVDGLRINFTPRLSGIWHVDETTLRFRPSRPPSKWQEDHHGDPGKIGGSGTQSTEGPGLWWGHGFRKRGRSKRGWPS